MNANEVCPHTDPEGLLKRHSLRKPIGRKEEEKDKILVGLGSCRTPAGRTSPLTTPKYLGI
jgi:hypothetical protein